MVTLKAVLQRWQGPEYFREKFRQRGFRLGENYQALVAGSCSLDDTENLICYWAEVAKEHVSSAGTTESDSRQFRVSGCYRSQFLDQLALEKEKQTGEIYQKSLSICFRRFRQRELENREYLKENAEKYATMKKSEIARLNVEELDWNERRSEVTPILGAHLSPLGFKRTGLHQFSKRLSNGLVFVCFVVTGGRERCKFNIPIEFVVRHIDDSDQMFHPAFQVIEPGFELYSYYLDSKSARLGIQAHANIFDVFSESFS
jgi:hypothetical protein